MSSRVVRAAWLLLALALLAPSIAACLGDDEPTTQVGTSPSGTTPTIAAAATMPSTSSPSAAQESTATVSNSSATQSSPSRTQTNSSVTPTVAVREPWSPLQFAYGFNVAWAGHEGGADMNQRTIELMDGAGFDWVRVHFYWADIQRDPSWWDPLPVDRVIEQYEGSDVRILATLSNPPDWAVDPTGQQLLTDFDTWKTFVGFMVDRYKGRIDAWEIWNEQNHAITVKGTIRTEDYPKLLERAYTVIKEVDPQALVVFGGLTPTGVNDPSIAIDDVEYLRTFYELDGGYYSQFFDILGAHANATNNPPDLLYPENPGEGDWSQHPSFYFRRVEHLRDVMTEFGDDRPMWITEFGWTTANQAPGYEYGAETTEEEQAQYLVRAYEIMTQDWDFVTGGFVWNLNFSIVAPPEDEKYPWSVLNADWSPRSAYEALAAMPKE